MTRATRRATKTDTLIQNARGEHQIRGLNRHRIIPRVVQPPSSGANTPPSGQGSGTTGNFLEPQGDTMIGAIAFSPQTATQDITDPNNPTIDIGKDGEDYSTYVITGIESNKLGTILNATFDGQLLYLQSVNASPSLELINGDAINLGNILTGTGASIFVDFGNFVILIFDARSSTGGAGIQGAWRVVVGGTSTPGGATQLNDLTDVTLTSPALDDVLTFDGAFWVNLPSTSGGLATDLSNMISPTLPTVDLSLNGNSLVGVLNVDFDGFGGILGLSNLQWNQLGQNMTSLSQGLLYNVDSLQSHEFDVGGTSVVKIEEQATGLFVMDMFSNRIDDADSINFNFTGQTDQIINRFSMGGLANGAGRINWAQDGNLIFTEQGTTRIAFNKFLLVGYTIDNLVGLTIEDATTDPIINGQLFRNGVDVKVFSGGALRNFSDIGEVVSNQIFQGNTSITILDTGTGSITDIIDGAIVSTKDVNNFAISQSVSFGANSLSGLGNTTPGGTNNFELGGATLFWTKVFTNEVIFQSTENVIKGDSPFGINYEVVSGDNHDFLVGGFNKLRIEGAVVNVFTNLDLNNQNIVNVDDLTMQGTGSILNMSGGDIISVDDITFTGSGSTITNLDDLIFRSSSSSSIDMNGGDIRGVDDLVVTDTITHGTSGNSPIGFFGQNPGIRRVVLNPAGTSNNALFTALNDLINALGTLTGFGLGLIDTQN